MKSGRTAGHFLRGFLRSVSQLASLPEGRTVLRSVIEEGKLETADFLRQQGATE